MSSGLITTYLGEGLAAARPATPSVGAGAIAFWYSTDSNQLSCYADGAWIENILAGGGGGYTDEQVRDVIGTALVAGTNVTLTVNDVGDTITIDVAGGGTPYTDEMARDALGAALVAGTGMTVTVNDGADTITLASTITQYTDEMARDALGTALTAGAGITITPNDGSDIITISRAAPSIQSVTSSATVTPTFADDQVIITAQAAALALANPTGTAADGYGISIRIKDNGTARAISYGTQYRAIGVTLPTTTVVNKTLYLGMIYNAADTKWDVVAVAQEA